MSACCSGGEGAGGHADKMVNAVMKCTPPPLLPHLHQMTDQETSQHLLLPPGLTLLILCLTYVSLHQNTITANSFFCFTAS